METVQIQNKNQAGTSLSIKGDTYELDENGVMTCSKLVASMLLETPGWNRYVRDFDSELEQARNQKLMAESEFRRAKERLARADERYEKLQRELQREKAASEDEEPEESAVAASGPEDEEPSAEWTKDRLVSYAREYEVELPAGNPTKAEILAAINEQLEDA